MSELKERDARELVINNLAYYPNEESMRVYLKSEADKVIAEKDEEIYNIKYSRDEWAKACNQKDKEIAELNARIADGDKDFEMANNQNERLLKIVRHHKYKRCLSMAKWCDERIYRIEKDYAFWRHGKDYAQNFYKKWRKRCLELAEKFKEAK